MPERPKPIRSFRLGEVGLEDGADGEAESGWLAPSHLQPGTP